MTQAKNVNLVLYPTRYGNNNILKAFQCKKMGFQLEIKTENSMHFEILSLEEVKNSKPKLKEH